MRSGATSGPGQSHLRYGMHSPPPKLVGLPQSNSIIGSQSAGIPSSSSTHKLIIEQLLAALGKDVRQIAQIRNEALTKLETTNLLDYLLDKKVLTPEQSSLVLKAERLREISNQRKLKPEFDSKDIGSVHEDAQLKHSATAATLWSQSSSEGRITRAPGRPLAGSDQLAKLGTNRFSDSFEGVIHNQRFESVVNQSKLSFTSLQAVQVAGKNTALKSQPPLKDRLREILAPDSLQFVSLCMSLGEESLWSRILSGLSGSNKVTLAKLISTLKSLESEQKASKSTSMMQQLSWLLGLPEQDKQQRKALEEANTQIVTLKDRISTLSESSVVQAISMGTLRDELKTCTQQLSEAKTRGIYLEKEIAVVSRHRDELGGEVARLQAELEGFKQLQIKSGGSVERENKRLREEIEGLILESEEMVSALQEIEENMHLQKQQWIVADPAAEESPRPEDLPSSSGNKESERLRTTTEELNILKIKYDELALVAAEHEAVAKDLRCRLDQYERERREFARSSAERGVYEGSSGSSQVENFFASTKEVPQIIKENSELIEILRKAAVEIQSFKELLPADEEIEDVIHQTDFLDALKEIHDSSAQRSLPELLEFNQGLWESVEHYRQLKQKILNNVNSREGQTSSGRLVMGVDTPNTPWSGATGRSPEGTVERSGGAGIPEIDEPTGGSASVEDELSPEQLVELLLQVLQLCEQMRNIARQAPSDNVQEANSRLQHIAELIEEFRLFGEGGTLGEFLGSRSPQQDDQSPTGSQAYYLPGQRKPRQGKSHKDTQNPTTVEHSQLEEMISLLRQQAEVREVTVRDLQMALTAALKQQGSAGKALEQELLRVIEHNERLATELRRLQLSAEASERERPRERLGGRSNTAGFS